MATASPQAISPTPISTSTPRWASPRRRYADAHPNSRAQIERAKRSMPGGNTRTILFFQPFPVVIKRSEGCRVWDIDGNDYVDFLGEYTAGLFGHSDPVIKAAIQGALDTGWVHGGHIESETVLAEAVCARFPSIERVRFTNSGTEANLMAITTARLHTKRDKVMVMRGGYHGGVLLFKTGSIPQNAPYPYVLGAYNDAAATVKAIEANAKDLACVLIEPMQGSSGCIPADPAFLQALREACTKHGIVLIFDEVMTSRLAPGGLQERHGVIPDMTTLGKYVGGGCSFGAFGGRADVMAIYDPYRADAIAHAGTFNNNAMTMAAGVAAMTQVYTPARAKALNEAGDVLRARLNGEATKRGLPVQVTGLGSMMNVHFRGGAYPQLRRCLGLQRCRARAVPHRDAGARLSLRPARHDQSVAADGAAGVRRPGRGLRRFPRCARARHPAAAGVTISGHEPCCARASLEVTAMPQGHVTLADDRCAPTWSQESGERQQVSRIPRAMRTSPRRQAAPHRRPRSRFSMCARPGSTARGIRSSRSTCPTAGSSWRSSRLVPRKATPIVLLDDGDGVAEKAARRLAALGYSDVAILDGGAPGWAKAGYTLFKGVNLPSKAFGEIVEHIQHTPSLSAEELKARVDKGEKLIILDGRSPQEYRRMTIPGARSIPNAELAHRLPALVADDTTTIVVNCAGRTRSIIGAQSLRNAGVKNPVIALRNGTQGWMLAGLTLENGTDPKDLPELDVVGLGAIAGAGAGLDRTLQAAGDRPGGVGPVASGHGPHDVSARCAQLEGVSGRASAGSGFMRRADSSRRQPISGSARAAPASCCATTRACARRRRRSGCAAWGMTRSCSGWMSPAPRTGVR